MTLPIFCKTRPDTLRVADDAGDLARHTTNLTGPLASSPNCQITHICSAIDIGFEEKHLSLIFKHNWDIKSTKKLHL